MRRLTGQAYGPTFQLWKVGPQRVSDQTVATAGSLSVSGDIFHGPRVAST
jgi:hypothetical protein